LLTYPKADLAY